MDEMGWYGKNSGGKTHSVGQKKENKFALYDMHGNVWEWVQDWDGPYSGNAVTDPSGPATGSGRVFRGGGWDSGAQFVRSAFRHFGAPFARIGYVGFRLVRE